MAVVEVIIKISEDVYTRLFDYGRPMDIADGIVIDRAIRTGIPLSKDHGRIMDVDKIIKKMEKREEQLKDDRSMWETACVETAIDMFGETIIEADNSEDIVEM